MEEINPEMFDVLWYTKKKKLMNELKMYITLSKKK